MVLLLRVRRTGRGSVVCVCVCVGGVSVKGSQMIAWKCAHSKSDNDLTLSILSLNTHYKTDLTHLVRALRCYMVMPWHCTTACAAIRQLLPPTRSASINASISLDHYKGVTQPPITPTCDYACGTGMCALVFMHTKNYPSCMCACTCVSGVHTLLL